MADSLIAHFVDGSDAEVKIIFNEKRVEMIAFDEKARQWYQLVFAECTSIKVNYSDWEDQWVDLNNLMEGISELDPSVGGVRNFETGFADESVLQIDCKSFVMEPISRPLPWEQ